MDINQLKQEIERLTADERRRLLSDIKLEHYEGGDYVKKVLTEKSSNTAVSCPRCKGLEFVSRGSHKGVKRYQCKNCGRYFSANNGTALHGIHKKDKWQQYVECMQEGLSLRKSAKKVGISYQTAFNWRHKILSSTKDLQPSQLSGIIEVDDTFFAHSEKGNQKLNRKARKRGDSNKTLRENKVPVVVATDRNGNTILNVAGKGSVKRKDLRPIMKGKFHPESILCSDGANVYKGLAIQEGIKHIKAAVHSRPVAKDKTYNIQSVNQLHKELKNFMSRFNGVSTKYLQHYLYWFMMQKKRLEDNDKIKQIVWISVTYSMALERYQAIKQAVI